MPQEYTDYGDDALPYDGQKNAVTQIASFMRAMDNRLNRRVNLTGSRGTDYDVTADDMESGILEANWAQTANVVAKIPLTDGRKTVFKFLNRTTGGSYTVTVKTTDAGSTGVEVPRGSVQELAIDGINISPNGPPTAVSATSLSTGLVGYWKLEEASGSRADSAGSNTLTDNATVTQATGKVSYGAQFTAANSEYLSIADNAALSMGDIDFTICGWVYFDSIGANRGLVGKWGTTGQLEYFVQFESSDNKLVFYVSNNGTATASVRSSTTLAAGQWYFFRAWHDAAGNTIQIQLDAGSAASTAHTTGVFDGTSAFELGRNGNAGGNFHNGRLDEVGVWKRALTSGEHALLYNSGSGRTMPL